MSLKTKEILNKWTPLLEGEGLPEIAGKNKQALVAQILEAQEKDSKTDPVYRDDKLIEAFGQSLMEAEVAGDHGYDPTNIAAGQSSGAITNIGPASAGRRDSVR